MNKNNQEMKKVDWKKYLEFKWEDVLKLIAIFAASLVFKFFGFEWVFEKYVVCIPHFDLIWAVFFAMAVAFIALQWEKDIVLKKCLVFVSFLGLMLLLLKVDTIPLTTVLFSTICTLGLITILKFKNMVSGLVRWAIYLSFAPLLFMSVLFLLNFFSAVQYDEIEIIRVMRPWSVIIRFYLSIMAPFFVVYILDFMEHVKKRKKALTLVVLVFFIQVLFLSNLIQDELLIKDPCYLEIQGKGPIWDIKDNNVCMGYTGMHSNSIKYTKTLDGADAGTFKELGKGYFYDKNHIYYHSEVLGGVNQDNFRVIDVYCATDGEKYFKQGELLDEPCGATYKGSDTGKWQAYENEKYDFEFKYPSDWILTDHYSDAVEGMIKGFRYVSLETADGFIVGIGVKNQSEDEWFFTHSRRTGLAAGEFAQLKKINVGEGVAEEKSLVFNDPNGNFTQTVWFCAPIRAGEKVSQCNDFAIGKGKVARAEIDRNYKNGKATEEQWRNITEKVEKVWESL
ncbi:DKNYY domain-containing protein [Patescibacteria group bacterium]